MGGILLTLSFEHILVIRVLLRPRGLLLLITGLALHRVSHLLVSVLFEGHRGQVVSWLEHLLLVLTSERHSIVNIFVSHLDAIDRFVFAHWVNILLHNVALNILVGLRPRRIYHHRQFLDVIRPDMGHLQRLHLITWDRRTSRRVFLDLLRGQASRMLQHFYLHVRESQLFEGLHDGEFYLSHEKVALHFLILIVFQPIKVGLERLFQLEVSNLSVTVLHLASKGNHGVVLRLLAWLALL